MAQIEIRLEEKIEKFPIILFDSECTLCNRFKLTLEKSVPDHQYNFISVHNSLIYAKHPQLNKEHCLKEVHMLFEDGKVISGKDVISELVTQHPIVSKFSWLLDSEVGKKAIELFYNSANKYRESLLNRCPKCKTSK